MADPLLDVLNQILGRLISIESRLTVIEKRAALTQQLAFLATMQTGGILEMTIKIDDLVAKVTAQATVIDGVVVLLGDLNTHLKEAIAENDPVKLQAVADALDANTTRLANAAAANTTAAPAEQPVVDPAPAPVDPNAPTT